MQWASGVRTTGEAGFTITGLAFKPVVVCLYNSTVSGGPMTAWSINTDGLSRGYATYSNQTTNPTLTPTDDGFTIAKLSGYSQGKWSWWAVGM